MVDRTGGDDPVVAENYCGVGYRIMSFILLAFLAFLMCVLFMTYRKTIIAAGVIFFLFALTTASVLYGLNLFASMQEIYIFNSAMTKREFVHLVIGWYVLDAICAGIIIRNHREYRKVNRPR
jgi:hypothetical protein